MKKKKKDSTKEEKVIEENGRNSDNVKDIGDFQQDSDKENGDVDIYKLKEELKKARSETQENLEHLKRMKAEFDNYRKRTSRQLQENFGMGEKTLAGDLLVVLDNLQRALDYRDVDIEGLDLIKKEFFNILKAKGLREMESYGRQFDHNLHHAVSFIETDDTDEGYIIDVLQPGYFWGDEVLRPAMAVVSKSPGSGDGESREAGGDKQDNSGE